MLADRARVYDFHLDELMGGKGAVNGVDYTVANSLLSYNDQGCQVMSKPP